VFEKFETCYFEPNTNNKAELYAAIRGLEKFLEYSKEITFEDTLTIYTDSAYTLNGITSWIYGWRARGWKTSTNSNVLNKDLWIQLDTLNKRVNQIIDTQWSKVKGHADNKYNNRVDKLANIAMDNWSRIEVDNCF
jgi:ribonuclease HI